MRISRDALRGYILEEVLAYLIRNAGYRLLVEARQDPIELVDGRNGLGVRGRGGIHQVDVLGQLEWIPAFTFPVRLFVEAKFRKGKAGIQEIRKAVGLLADLQQNLSTHRLPIYPQKYRYCFALFSASGFTEPASRMAFVHEISLIDLGLPEFARLREAITAAADNIIRGHATEPPAAQEEADERDIQPQAVSDQDEEDHADAATTRRGLVRSIRAAIRDELNTKPMGFGDGESPTLPALKNIAEIARDYGEVFLGMANGPFILFLHSPDPAAFIRFASEQPRHQVQIRWSRHIDDGLTWWIEPKDYPGGYRLTFRLPQILSEWMLALDFGRQQAAIDIKRNFLSQIFIYRVTDQQDQLFRLEFSAEQVTDEWRQAIQRRGKATNEG